jgi:hypothetical protein
MSDIQVGIVVFLFVFICFSAVIAMDLFGIHKRLREIDRLLRLLTAPSKQDTDDKDNVTSGEGKNE